MLQLWLFMLSRLLVVAACGGVGADVMGHYKTLCNDDHTRYLDIWLQGEVLHLIPGRRPASFI